MSPLHFNIDPDNVAKSLARHVKAAIQILIWGTIGLASIAATCIVLAGIWTAVKLILKTIGY